MMVKTSGIDTVGSVCIWLTFVILGKSFSNQKQIKGYRQGVDKPAFYGILGRSLARWQKIFNNCNPGIDKIWYYIRSRSRKEVMR